MKCILICFMLGYLSYIPFTYGEMDYFPGLRRPPSMQNWLQSAPDDEGRMLLAQLNSIIEEQARRRFQNQLQLQQQQQQQVYQGNQIKTDTMDMMQPEAQEFSYDFNPIRQIENLNEEIPFAVSPVDPRYYDHRNKQKENGKSKMSANSVDKEDYEDTAGKEDDVPEKSSSDGVPYFKLKAPMNVNPKFLDYPLSSQSRDVMTREEINEMIEKLKEHEKMRHKEMILQRNDVIQKPLDIDSVMGMYVVALVAGISAAITVGLISLGIAWYTLHKKAKAAADVEYPAYGVTGPNKDISPSGDRRLAQSAQMYHYQHQKQQIIAMENRSNNGDRNTSLSDVISDDENEEGDYTVYECPGLAPTGEMEVKNPLFLDDPTPATPASQTTQQSQQQSSAPPTLQQKQEQSNQPSSKIVINPPPP